MKTNLQNRECVETADRLLNRVSASTCSFTAADAAAKTLEENGFEEIFLQDAEWQVGPGGRYFVSVNTSTVYAFAVGSQFVPTQAAEPEQMFRLAAAHTDHPCLYVKSRPEIRSHGYGKLNVEIYGVRSSIPGWTAPSLQRERWLSNRNIPFSRKYEFSI